MEHDHRNTAVTGVQHDDLSDLDDLFGRSTAPVRMPWPEPPAGLCHHVRTIMRSGVDPSREGPGEFVTVALFPVGSATATKDDVAAIDCYGLDADAGDWIAAKRILGYQASTPSTAKMALHRMAGEDPDGLADLLDEHRAVVLEAVAGSGIPFPTVVVDSGYGTHLWWWLDRVVYRTQGPEFVPVLAGQARMARHINLHAGWGLIDDCCTNDRDAARRLRLPGSWNRKTRIHPRRVTEVSRLESSRIGHRHWANLCHTSDDDWVLDMLTGEPYRPDGGRRGGRGVHADFRTMEMSDGHGTLYDRIAAHPRGTKGIRLPAWLPHTGHNSVLADHRPDGSMLAYHFSTSTTYIHGGS